MKVWINGKKVGGDISQNPSKTPVSITGEDAKEEYTGGVNWVKPIADISEYLVDGENTIVIEYGSTLTNVQLDRGVLQEQENRRNWLGRDVAYQSYGPAQAVIVPFVETTVE